MFVLCWLVIWCPQRCGVRSPRLTDFPRLDFPTIKRVRLGRLIFEIWNVQSVPFPGNQKQVVLVFLWTVYFSIDQEVWSKQIFLGGQNGSWATYGRGGYVENYAILGELEPFWAFNSGGTGTFLSFRGGGVWPYISGRLGGQKQH